MQKLRVRPVLVKKQGRAEPGKSKFYIEEAKSLQQKDLEILYHGLEKKESAPQLIADGENCEI